MTISCSEDGLSAQIGVGVDDSSVPRDRHWHQPTVFTQVHGVQSRRGLRERGVEGGEQRIADLQAGHMAHIAGLIYMRGIMELAGAFRSPRSAQRVYLVPSKYSDLRKF
jgi:hypothetical protein